VEGGIATIFPGVSEAIAVAGAAPAAFNVLTSASSLGISSSRTSLSARLPSSVGSVRSWVLTSDNYKGKSETAKIVRKGKLTCALNSASAFSASARPDIL